MQFIIEGIRKIVVLVLLMELVLQLQSGKQYEAYIKMLVGIMVVYSLIRGIFGVWGNLEQQYLEPMQEFQWSGNWYDEFEEKAKEQVTDETSSVVEEVQIDNIVIGEIKIKEVEKLGGVP